MSSNVLTLLFWIVARGQATGNRSFGAGRSDGALGLRVATLLRVIAILAGSIGLLSLALWAAVWLTIRLL